MVGFLAKEKVRARFFIGAIVILAISNQITLWAEETRDKLSTLGTAVSQLSDKKLYFEKLRWVKEHKNEPIHALIASRWALEKAGINIGDNWQAETMAGLRERLLEGLKEATRRGCLDHPAIARIRNLDYLESRYPDLAELFNQATQYQTALEARTRKIAIAFIVISCLVVGSVLLADKVKRWKQERALVEQARIRREQDLRELRKALSPDPLDVHEEQTVVSARQAPIAETPLPEITLPTDSGELGKLMGEIVVFAYERATSGGPYVAADKRRLAELSQELETRIKQLIENGRANLEPVMIKEGQVVIDQTMSVQLAEGKRRPDKMAVWFTPGEDMLLVFDIASPETGTERWLAMSTKELGDEGNGLYVSLKIDEDGRLTGFTNSYDPDLEEALRNGDGFTRLNLPSENRPFS